MRRRLFKGIALAILLLIVAPIAAMHMILRASLPRLEGEIETHEVVAPVSIERDARGVPTITAHNRSDLAYGTGFVHGQDRFFQMDLSRRLAAGELSELFGEVALAQDKAARIFRFRHVARQVLAQATPQQRALISAYTRGVNAGLVSLRGRPWEYWVLGASPVPWRDEDSVLTVHAMWWDLQYRSLEREKVRVTLNEKLSGSQCEGGWKCAMKFLYPERTRWDAPNVTDQGALQAQLADANALSQVPSEQDLDLRKIPSQGNVVGAATPASPESDIGSNNWAVAGRLTSSGAALVASDMHLGLRVPIAWYRARLKIANTDEGAPRTGGVADQPLDINGVTLPGAPVLVAGSNGRVAWSFTNSYGDWGDLHAVSCSPQGPLAPSTAEGPLTVLAFPEIIHVKGAEDVVIQVQTSRLGVLMQQDREHCWFASWLAQSPAATNLNMLSFERATSVRQILNDAASVGIPHQNLIAGDANGHIGWTIVGRIPTTTDTDRTSGRAAWLSADAYPHMTDPQLGRLWSANARPIQDPAAEAVIGGDESLLGADYALGARASQIRDGLLALRAGATPAQMLRIQLDDRALFLAHWQKFLVDLLDDDAIRGKPFRAELKRLAETWQPYAASDSAGYRLVRAFRSHTERTVWQMILGALKIDTDVPPPAQFEQPLWTLVNEKPMHMLAEQYPSWREFLLTQVDQTIADLDARCGSLATCKWGDSNPVRVRHPLSKALAFASQFLDMPTYLLSGDHDMPRVQDGAFGASERFAVSPGHEQEGYLHIAGGQSGHPLSPFYRAGFREWAEGKPLPFLPGEPKYELVLAPP